MIEWTNDTDRKLDAVEICFETDGNGDISELGLLSSGFFIMSKEEERYQEPAFIIRNIGSYEE